MWLCGNGMFRPTSAGVRYVRLYALFPEQFGQASSHLDMIFVPDASSQTTGAAVPFDPNPDPLIVTVDLCDHVPDVVLIDGCA